MNAEIEVQLLAREPSVIDPPARELKTRAVNLGEPDASSLEHRLGPIRRAKEALALLTSSQP